MSLIHELLKVRYLEKVSFHIPGHKFGKQVSDLFRSNVLEIDSTEIYGTDNLHDAKGILLDAMERASNLYGSYRTFFLVNGTTSGNHIAILSSVDENGTILILSDVHKSVYTGIMLSGGNFIVSEPVMSSDGQASIDVDFEYIEDALIRNKSISAILVTYPNYYGYGFDLNRLIELAHKHDVIVIVDNAHGAHLKWVDGGLKCPVSLGADIVVQSIHKTLPAMTQCSLLHVNGNRVSMDRLSYYFSALQTSSPSYPLMASIDGAMELMNKDGYGLMKDLIDNIRLFKKSAKELGIKFYEETIESQDLILDETRISISPVGMARSGYDLDKVLREKYGIYCEMATWNCIVLVATISNTKDEFDCLLQAVSREYAENTLSNEFIPVIYPLYIKDRIFNYKIKAAVFEKRQLVDIENAYLKYASDFVIAYPPGIPILIPGQKIDDDVLSLLKVHINCDNSLMGLIFKEDRYFINIIDCEEYK